MGVREIEKPKTRNTDRSQDPWSRRRTLSNTSGPLWGEPDDQSVTWLKKPCVEAFHAMEEWPMSPKSDGASNPAARDRGVKCACTERGVNDASAPNERGPMGSESRWKARILDLLVSEASLALDRLDLMDIGNALPVIQSALQS